LKLFEKHQKTVSHNVRIPLISNCLKRLNQPKVFLGRYNALLPIHFEPKLDLLLA
jgi:hypothetical protein